MLSNISQFAPQGLVHGNIWPGYEQLGQQGGIQQLPPWAGTNNPVGLNQLTQPPIVQVLGQLAQQLAQQLAIQNSITQQLAQQINVAVQHLGQQLGIPSLHGQYYGQNPYVTSMQGGYSGFNPQQAWGTNRTSTIQ